MDNERFGARCAAVFAAMMSSVVGAGDAFGVFVGGSVGESHVEAATQVASGSVYGGGLQPLAISQTRAAFKVIAGYRPFSLFGIELAYLNLGHAHGNFTTYYPASVSMDGGSAFTVLYIPLHVIELFGKVGIARIESRLATTEHFYCGCGNQPLIDLVAFELDQVNTDFAAGVGVQHRFGPWAMRAEYERFYAAGANPGLLSLGMTWSF